MHFRIIENSETVTKRVSEFIVISKAVCSFSIILSISFNVGVFHASSAVQQFRCHARLIDIVINKLFE